MAKLGRWRSCQRSATEARQHCSILIDDYKRIKVDSSQGAQIVVAVVTLEAADVEPAVEATVEVVAKAMTIRVLHGSVNNSSRR